MYRDKSGYFCILEAMITARKCQEWKPQFYYVFLGFFPGLQHGKGAEVYGAAQPKGSSLQQPFFDTMIDPDTGQGGRNVTTAEGGKSLLFCTIRHLGKNNTVRRQKRNLCWWRHNNVHLCKNGKFGKWGIFLTLLSQSFTVALGKGSFQ